MNEATLPFAVPPVVKTVTVRCPPERAFHLFTADIAAWWPLQRVHVAPDPVACIFERRPGGRIFERAKDGTETEWGRVEVWEPPHRLAFSWVAKLTEAEAQRVEILFTPDAAGTRVHLTHSGWEKVGARGADMRERYNNGWVLVFDQSYAAYANSA